MILSRAATKRRSTSLSLFYTRHETQVTQRNSVFESQIHRQNYSTLWVPRPIIRHGQDLCIYNNNDNSHNSHNNLYSFTQVRFKRNDGSKAFFKQSKVSKKHKKLENRRRGELEFEQKGKHGAPGSKAGPKRQWAEEKTQELIDWKKRGGYPEDKDAALEYGHNDALLDDLMGNTSHLNSTPSPEPIYLGEYHEQLLIKTQSTMRRYEAYVAKHTAATTDEEKAAIPLVPPPDDRQISLVLRAFRDKNGTKGKPVGLVKALVHIMEDLKVPTTLFGEHCFTTLLTCCKTPKEAHKVLDLMRQRDHPIGVYSWSILIDIHARLGDFQACNRVIEEMKAAGFPPGLPAYTSLMAACYKVCNSGQVPSSVRSEAGNLGWEKWKEMRINGVETDAMAFGAILRLLAARGRPEQAINVLEEMRQFQVKPTTLCFTAALKAVARSHEISVRFENGASKRYRRREQLTLYHGRMTRDIVIKAEQAEVVQDDGFVAALMLCAAAAGDSATAKAILLASEVRRMDHLRTIGPDSHLAALNGMVEQQDIINGLAQVSGGIKNLVLPEKARLQLMASESGDLVETDYGITPGVATLLNNRKRRTAFEEREFGGKDNRVLTALMNACASAIDAKGMGSMWAGKQNKGYLHEDSLRLIASIQKPLYHDNSVPGTSGTEVGISGMNLYDDGAEEISKRLRREKYIGGKVDPSWGFDMDTIDPEFRKMHENDYTRRKEEEHEEVMRRLHLMQGRDWTGMPVPSLEIPPEEEDDGEVPELLEQTSKMYFNAKTGKVEPRPDANDQGGYTWDEATKEWIFKTPSHAQEGTKSPLNTGAPSVSKPNIMEPKVPELQDTGPKEEWYFDQDEMKWQSKIVYPEAPTTVNEVKDQKPTVSTTTDKIEEMEEEYYFDQDESKWKTRPKAGLTEFEKEILAMKGNVVSNNAESLVHDYASAKNDKVEEDNPFTYEHFKTLMARENNGVFNIPEHDARQMYEEMKQEFDEEMLKNPGSVDEAMRMLGLEDPKKKASTEFTDIFPPEYFGNDRSKSKLVDMLNPKSPTSAGFYDPDGTMASILKNSDIKSLFSNDTPNGATNDDSLKEMAKWFKDTDSDDEGNIEGDYNDDEDESQSFPADFSTVHGQTSVVEEKSALEYDLDDLQVVLPGMPRSRLLKVREAFRGALKYPSMITLVPLLRENMPDRIDNAWLKKRNILNAYFCVEKAKEDNLVDHHMVNGMLQVVTSAGKVRRAIAVHEEQFKGYGVEPNEYSDRLVLQMLVKCKRLPRALEFKQKIESEGRNADLASYGSLIQYYTKRDQVGSALMTLRECVEVHGSPPKEGDMSRLRLLCRQQEILEETGLVALAGADPLEWLRHGEANLKREKSYRGRRGVQEALNKSY